MAAIACQQEGLIDRVRRATIHSTSDRSTLHLRLAAVSFVEHYAYEWLSHLILKFCTVDNFERHLTQLTFCLLLSQCLHLL